MASKKRARPVVGQPFYIPPGGIPIGQSTPVSGNGNTLSTGPDGQPVGGPATNPAGTGQASGSGGGIFDPKQLIVDTTNPAAKPIIAKLTELLMGRMSGPQGPQGNTGGPMAQLYGRQGMPVFNPAAILAAIGAGGGGGGQAPPPNRGSPAGGGSITPGGYNNPTNPGANPRTAKPRTNFQPVSAGAHSIRSYQPQFTNQHSANFDPEAFLRSL